MKFNGHSRRARGRGFNPRRGPSRNQVFDSNGPDVRIRGTAQQVAEKYEALAKDAQASGDYVLAQNYLQHAEHYLRVLGTIIASDNRQSNIQDDDLGLPQSVIPPANAPQEISESETAGDDMAAADDAQSLMA